MVNCFGEWHISHAIYISGNQQEHTELHCTDHQQGWRLPLCRWDDQLPGLLRNWHTSQTPLPVHGKEIIVTSSKGKQEKLQNKMGTVGKE